MALSWAESAYALEIEEELQVIESRGGKIKKISIIGYSLGGLVARYAIGLLHAKGVLRRPGVHGTR